MSVEPSSLESTLQKLSAKSRPLNQSLLVKPLSNGNFFWIFLDNGIPSPLLVMDWFVCSSLGQTKVHEGWIGCRRRGRRRRRRSRSRRKKRRSSRRRRTGVLALKNLLVCCCIADALNQNVQNKKMISGKLFYANIPFFRGVGRTISFSRWSR